MAKISYRVEKDGESWILLRNGESQATYATQEAAFTVAASGASADLRSGYSVSVEATAPTNPEGASDLGGKPTGGDGFS
jgi:hypothetical protein